MLIGAIIRIIMSILRRGQSQGPDGGQPAGERRARRQRY
jgi:hypothetical protein